MCFWVAGEIYTKPTRLWLPLIIQAPRKNVVERRLLRAGGAAPCWPLDRPPVCARVLDKCSEVLVSCLSAANGLVRVSPTQVWRGVEIPHQQFAAAGFLDVLPHLCPEFLSAGRVVSRVLIEVVHGDIWAFVRGSAHY